ncbi:phosphonoacetaldehyde hydrolase [uncultured Brevundimonas sp.]|uniref:phosphonoacetaldehyde hydrolase n=1 Tax=uncultured Brevundimonas sp. TaxID=213418 RepID=UPI002598746A|nr:phosphonoacetaldehyde hydrolase [uncultured Brevundimonas sp.]
MSAIKAVVFDWAGTMVDFGSCAPVRALKAVFADAGVPIGDGPARRYMGMAKRAHVTAILSEAETGDLWRAEKGADWTEADIDELMAALEPAMRREAEATAELIPGALEALEALRARGVQVGSTTGYTRTMMAGILPRAADQGYRPETVVCAGETREGRPAPLMIWKALVELGAWPTDAAVVVDDAAVGVEAGRNAGCWSVGLAGSGNGVGLPLADYLDLSPQDRATRLAEAAEAHEAAGADVVIESVAQLSQALAIIDDHVARGLKPGQADCVCIAPVRA